MRFNNHYELEGKHSFLSASKYHWIRYTPDKLSAAYLKFLAKEKGTRLHEFACECIRLGVKLPKTKRTLNMYVNDAIGYKMETEVTLYYSPNAFGTADAIKFSHNLLRIHDYKSGESPTSMDQLQVYVAYFCLEYKVDPRMIDIELRIYQCDDVVIYIPLVEDILFIMDQIINFDKQIEILKIGE